MASVLEDLDAIGTQGHAVDQWEPILQEAAAQHPEVPESVVRGIIERESSGNPYATADTKTHLGKARGLGQFVDATAQRYIPDWRGPDDSYNAKKNIQGIYAYMDDLIKQNGGDTEKALRQYHGAGRDVFGTTGDAYAGQVLKKASTGNILDDLDNITAARPAKAPQKPVAQPAMADVAMNPNASAPGPVRADEQPGQGLLTPGNIDVHNLPIVKNPDGSISTVLTKSFNIDGKEVLLPTIVGGKKVSDTEAIAQ